MKDSPLETVSLPSRSRLRGIRVKNSRINPQRKSISDPPFSSYSLFLSLSSHLAESSYCRLIPDTRPRFTRGQEPISHPHQSYIYLIRRFVGGARTRFGGITSVLDPSSNHSIRIRRLLITLDTVRLNGLFQPSERAAAATISRFSFSVNGLVDRIRDSS